MFIKDIIDVIPSILNLWDRIPRVSVELDTQYHIYDDGARRYFSLYFRGDDRGADSIRVKILNSGEKPVLVDRVLMMTVGNNTETSMCFPEKEEKNKVDLLPRQHIYYFAPISAITRDARVEEMRERKFNHRNNKVIDKDERIRIKAVVYDSLNHKYHSKTWLLHEDGFLMYPGVHY